MLPVHFMLDDCHCDVEINKGLISSDTLSMKYRLKFSASGDFHAEEMCCLFLSFKWDLR